MPKRSQNKVSAKKKSTLDTKWLNNAMKSIGAASAATFKSIAPNISSSVSDTTTMVNGMRKSLKGVTANKVGKMMAQNRYVTLAKDTLNQSIKDVKSGNLYNPDRATEKMTNSMFGDDFDDFTDSFDEDGEASVTFNYFDEGDSDETSNASLMISEAISNSSEAQLKASKAQIDALIGVSSASIAQVQQGFSETNEKLDTISTTLDALLKYHEENTTNYYEHAIAAFERIGSAVTEDMSMTSSDNPLDVFKSSSGGLNGNAYKNYVKKRIQRVVDESPAGMILPWLKDDDMLEMIVSDPVGGITKGVIGGMIPKVVEGTLKEVDKTFGELIPNMLTKISNWDNIGNGKLKRFIGKIFGVKIDTKNTMNSSEIDKESATFDNMTRNAIVEVLPKYARESTAYLRQIAMHVTKTKDGDSLLSDAQIFDPTTNSYKAKKDLMKEFTDGFTDAVKQAFTSSDFGKALNGISDNLNEKNKKSYEEALQQFFTEITQSEKGMDVSEYNLNDENSNIHKILARVNKGKGKDILTEAIRYMYDNNIAIGSAAQAQLNAKRVWNERMDDVSNNYDRYNTLALGLDSKTDFRRMIERAQGNKAAIALDEAAKKEQEKQEREAEREKRKDPKYRLRNAGKIARGSIDEWVADENRVNNRNLSGGFIGDRFTREGFSDGISQMGGHVKSGMFNIMKGDARGAMSEFASIFTDQIKTMWSGVQENFFKPLGEKLFGKDEDGNNQGLFAGTRDKLNDTYKAFIQRINGKSYKDSKGEVHDLKDGEETLVSKAFNIFKDVKEGVVYHLFGDKDDKEGKKNKVKGVFTTFTDSIKEGLKGWKTAIFGESEDGEENAKLDKEKIKESFMKNLPDAIVGGAGGALIGALSGGSLLGMAVGGPVGAAAMGFAGSFLMKSDKFKDYLFGPEIENPDGTKKRIGGLISEKAQNFFKDNKKSIIGGATVGALKSMVFPSSVGLLSSVVGGPIAGAALGAGWSLVKHSDMFQKFLYGDEETGKRGVIQAFKDALKGKGSGNKDDENKSFAMKALGMGAVGAGGFALSSALIGKMGLMGAMVTPGGPLGAAVIGAAVGIAASGNKFSKFLFGEKDEETGKRKGGLVQKFGNYLHVEVLAPMKSKIMGVIDDAKTTIKYDILENIRLPFVLVADNIKKKLGNAKEFIGDTIDRVAKAGFEKIIKPFSSIVDKILVQPVKKLVSTTTTIIYNTSKMILTAPFKAIAAIGRYTKTKIHGFFSGFRKFVFKGTTKLLGFTGGLIKTALTPFGKLMKGGADLVKGFIQKRKDKKAAKAKTGISGRLHSLMAKLTDDEWLKDYHSTKADRAEEITKNKKARAERSQRDYNRAQMSRILGYDAKYFTKENYEAAMKAAKEQKKKLRFRGNVEDLFEDDPAQKRAELLKQSTAKIARDGVNSPDIDIRMLSEAHTTNEILREIAQKYDISEERAKELYDELADQRREDAERAGYNYDEETGEISESDEGSNRPKRKGFFGNVKDSINAHVDSIADAGGIKSYLGNKMSDAKNFLNIRKGYEGSELQSYVNEGRSRVTSLFSKFGKARAKGGPANQNDPLLVGDGGSDMSAAEIFVPKSNGQILSQKDGGIKVSLVSMGRDAITFLKDAIAHPLGKKEEKKKKAEMADSLKIWRNELDDEDLKVGSFKKMSEAKRDMEAKEKQAEHDNAVLETLQEIRDKNSEHQNLWSKIFSKKGLITLAVAGVAGLVIKNFPAIMEVFSGIGNFITWWKSKHAGTDGKTSAELAKDTISDMGEAGSALKEGHIGEAASKFILDEGQYDANSGGRVSLLANVGRKGVKKVGKGVSLVKKGVNTVKSGVQGVKTIAKKLSGKAVQETAETAAQTTVKETAEDSVQLWARELAENTATNVTKESAESIVKSSTKTGAKKVISLIDDAFKAICEKIAKKCPNIASSKMVGGLKTVMSKVSKTVTDKFAKISTKITAVSSSKAVSAAVTLGLSTATFCTIGAINGASGAAKLFQVDDSHVDGWMRIISAAFGAIVAGTITGSIIDIVSGLVAEVLGFDFLNTVACIIYGIIAGKDNAEELNSAKEEFQKKYESYKDETISEQYETQKSAGIISSDVTLDQFKEGVNDGTYKISSQSFQDYNADQHQSIGYKIGKGFTKAGKSVKNFFTGKTSYTDDKGQTYADNGDGTYTVYDEKGKKIGNVSKDSVDVSTMESSTKGGVKGTFQKIGKGFGHAKDAAISGIKSAGNAVKSGFTKAGDAVSDFVKGGIDVGKAVNDGFAKIKANFNNSDMNVSDYLNADVNTLSEDNPLHGVVGGVLNISKYVMFPKLLIHGIMKRIGSNIATFVKDTAGKAATVVSNTTTEMSRLNKISTSGDLDALNNFTPSISEDNPIGGITKGVLTASKFLHYPSTLVHFAGNKVKDFIADKSQQAMSAISNTASEVNRLNQISSDGDLNALNNFTPSISEDNPIGGITNGVIMASKFLHYPSTVIHFAGNKVKEFIAEKAQQAATAVTNTATEINSLQEISKSGDLTKLNGFEPSVDESTPLAGVINAGLKGMKFLMYPSTLIHFAGNKISDFIGDVAEGVTDVGTDVKGFVSTLLEYTDNDKSMDSYDDEMMGDGKSLPSKILSPVIRNVIKFYVQFKRAINYVGDAISDKIGDIKNFFGNMLDSAKEWVNGDDSTETGGSGRGIRRRSFGGRGNEEPETQNGFSYYSQEDPRWKDRSYISGVNDGATMGDSGCGPTAMAMVASQAAQGKSISPTQMATMASNTGFRDETGTNEKFISYAGDQLGLNHMDVTNPSGDFIKSSVENGNPVVLNGVSNSNSAFTPAGHYVVAVGTDTNGNVLVNDPRGKQYNTSYSPEQLANSTRKAWSFGGNGLRALKSFGRKTKIGGRGTSGDWLSIVKSVKALIAQQHPEYSQSNYINITYNGKTLRVRTDCSGYVGACLQLYGAIPEGTNITSASLLNQGAIQSGFQYQNFTSWDALQQGDIISRSGHVEIFDRNDGGKHYVYSNGSTKTIASAEPTVTGHPDGYSVVWRPNDAGSGANVVSTDSTGASTGSNASSGNKFTDVISKVGGVFTKFASKAINGILTGNWDYNFSDDDTSASSSSDATVSNETMSAANITGTDTKEKLYNFLIGKGLTPAGAAGLMGNLDAESGIRTNNVQNSCESRVGSDAEYTAKVDNSSYTNFMNDSVGYGLAQWTSSGRKQALYQLAKKEGKSIADDGVQISHLWNELSEGYSDVLNTLKSAQDVKTASNKVLHDFEAPKDQSAAVENKRASLGQGYYDLYANKSTTITPQTQVVSSNGGTIGAYGTGPHKNRIQKMFGGRGLLDDISVSSDQENRYNVSSNTPITSKNNSGETVSTKTLEQLLNTTIKILQSIDMNTSKIEGLSNTPVSSDNYGGNIIVNKTDNSQTSVSENSGTRATTTPSSRNADLAMQIARGV